MPHPDPTFRQIGKHKDNVLRTIKVNNLRDRGSVRPPSIPLLCQDHGTINPFQWILIEPEHHEGIGEDKEEVHKEEMWPELMIPKPKGEYRVHVSIVESKDTLLAIVPPSRNAPICIWLN